MSRLKLSMFEGPELPITKIKVSGYKSISKETEINISPLTILAGRNSSGKSSIMQPLLLLKQTLDATYNPAAIVINGRNVRFTSSDQILTRIKDGKRKKNLTIGVEVANQTYVTTSFRIQSKKGLVPYSTKWKSHNYEIKARYGWSESVILKNNPFLAEILQRPDYIDMEREFIREFLIARERIGVSIILQNRYNITEDFEMKFEEPISLSKEDSEFDEDTVSYFPQIIEESIRSIIHLPALRGNPERTYGIAGLDGLFVGTFQEYATSAIIAWQEEGPKRKLQGLIKDLKFLGLSSKVEAERVSETQIRLKVNRYPVGDGPKKEDLVDVADVGFGVSQTLPILVALLIAKPDQLVYVEQPETHLHPLAQYRMAEILASAANRGVRVVVETHSALLLLGIQTAIAEKKIEGEKVALHWFSRDSDGYTVVETAQIGDDGSLGKWPQDFGKVTLDAQSRYLQSS